MSIFDTIAKYLMPRPHADACATSAALAKTKGPREYRLMPGYDWNPLKKHRNIPCPCGSGHKAKRCCGTFEALPMDVAEKVRAYLEIAR